MLLTRLLESLPLVCPRCGADIRIVAFITEAAPVQRILNHIGEPAEPPRIAPARGPPAWEQSPVDAASDWDTLWPNLIPSTRSTSRCSGKPFPRPALRTARHSLRVYPSQP